MQLQGQLEIRHFGCCESLASGPLTSATGRRHACAGGSGLLLVQVSSARNMPDVHAVNWKMFGRVGETTGAVRTAPRDVRQVSEDQQPIEVNGTGANWQQAGTLCRSTAKDLFSEQRCGTPRIWGVATRPHQTLRPTCRKSSALENPSFTRISQARYGEAVVSGASRVGFADPVWARGTSKERARASDFVLD